MAQFVETPNGVCVVNQCNAEFTICGDAFDLASDVEGYTWAETKARTVTCPRCASVVHDLRGVKTA